MRVIIGLFAISVIAGCSSWSPPPPPKCEGDFRPVNIKQQGTASLNHTQSLALCAQGGSNERKG